MYAIYLRINNSADIWSESLVLYKYYYFVHPFRHLSAAEYSVIGLPETPQVPIPTRPCTESGEAKMLFFLFNNPFFV